MPRRLHLHLSSGEQEAEVVLGRRGLLGLEAELGLLQSFPPRLHVRTVGGERPKDVVYQDQGGALGASWMLEEPVQLAGVLQCHHVGPLAVVQAKQMGSHGSLAVAWPSSQRDTAVVLQTESRRVVARCLHKLFLCIVHCQQSSYSLTVTDNKSWAT